jgi:MoaA/NifB/PqqE/SkfB family radical SAM enzyme
MSLGGTIAVVRMFARAAGRLPAGHLWYLLRRMRNEKPHRFDGQVRINTFFPPHPSAAFERFLSAVIERRRVPFSTYLAVTGDCPFKCPHCSYGHRPAGGLSTGELLDVIEQVRSIGTCTLGLTGGEPLLRGDLEDLVAAAGGAGFSPRAGAWPGDSRGRSSMATILFTTGHGLSDRRARRLAEAKLTCLTVGIESDDASAHDAIRGASGSFEAAAQAVQVSKAAGIYTAISTVGTRERIASGELERMYDLARRWGVGEFRLLAPVATGSAAGCGSFMLSDDERRTLYDFHVLHNRRRGGPAVASFAYLESAEMFGCGAGYHHLFIDAAGEVCPCDLTPLSFGNVMREPLAEIWRRMGELFTAPRRGCLMGELAPRLASARGDGGPGALPLPREQSEQLCASCAVKGPLPECYRRLPAEKG